jgi:hypothetical protein
VSLLLWAYSSFNSATRSPAFFDVIGAKKAHKETPMRLRARDGEARDFLKKVAQKLLIIGCSAPPPLNYNLDFSIPRKIAGAIALGLYNSSQSFCILN